ncbi:MAG: protein kinase [Polyangiaceae bacterium]
MPAPPRRPLDDLMQGAGRTQPSPSGCLSDEDVAAFAQGMLSAAEAERIERHVDSCEVCSPLLHQAMRALNTTLVSNFAGHAADWGATFAQGTVLAERWEIRRFIARGGMGEVYEAYDRQLQERVALKTVSASASDSPRAIRAFKAEVQLARRVTHANVCRIYDLGTHALKNSGVVHFLTMEFVEGETLGQLLRSQGALPLAQCQSFAKALLQALAAAHTAGILHRDFKSDNVMLRRDAAGQLSPVILDFGLARHIDERSRARSSGHAMVGTLTYMAPEQVEGGELSKATDIYAFGVVWFEMLTGRVPFAGSPQLSALERLTKQPHAPSRLNRQVPRFVDAAVLRCLARQPSQRFQDAPAVLSALEAATAPAIAPLAQYAPMIAAAAVLLMGSVVYAFVREEVPSKIARTLASAVTSAQLPLAARLPAPRASSSAPVSAGVSPSASTFAKTRAPKPRSSPKSEVPVPTASAQPQPSATAVASASSTPTHLELPKQRTWRFGRVPLPVTSSPTGPSAQNRVP